VVAVVVLVVATHLMRTGGTAVSHPRYVAQRMVEDQSVDAVVCIGILLKGGTIHMEVIANAMTKALLDLQLKTSTPVIFGVLTVFSMDQACDVTPNVVLL
jgi:6,7-dimethyl-8-ribityllumazine synthase